MRGLSHRAREDLKVTWQVWQLEQEVNQSLNKLEQEVSQSLNSPLGLGYAQIAVTDLLLGMLCTLLFVVVVMLNTHGAHLQYVEELQAQQVSCLDGEVGPSYSTSSLP